MHDDALKELWRGQPMGARPVLPDELQMASLKRRMKSFDRTIVRRDVVEVAACLLVIAFFSWELLFREQSALSRGGCSVLIASSVFIVWTLIGSKRRWPGPDPVAPVIEAVKSELGKVESQIGLLKTIVWWYLLPLFVGVVMCHLGTALPLTIKLINLAVTAGIFVFIYRLNQNAVTNHLQPLKGQLESLLSGAENREFDDAGRPRPTQNDPSRKVAGEPVEIVGFRIDFWQIVVYGEAGFVGFWFFLMLGLTEGAFARMFDARHLVWLPALALVGLLYSWALQKLTGMAVGISARGIHLYKGRCLVPWAAIKEVRPFRFLNIRSLWLIRETGEKSIMPWTGLERHAQVRAAVEAHAPKDHPIREALKILS